jgi:hypothetical protein
MNMKRLALLFFPAATIAFAMSDLEFFGKAEWWATAFGFKQHGYPYLIQQVTLSQLRVVTHDPCFAVSYWDRQGHVFIALVLGDEGLDQWADYYSVPRISGLEKRSLQETAIVHELLHGIFHIGGEETAAQFLGNLIARGGAYDTPIPEVWHEIKIPDADITPEAVTVIPN